MKTLEDIKTILSQHKPLVRDKYNVSELGVFGSYVRGEQNEESDVDVLIDYEEAPTLIQIVELENYLSDRLGIKVDVVTKNGLKSWIKERVLREVVYV